MNIEDFVHRVGRTGRAGKDGRAISFICSENKKMAKELAKVLRESNQEVPAQLDAMRQKNDYVNPRYQKKRYDNGGGSWRGSNSNGGYGNNNGGYGNNNGGYGNNNGGYGNNNGGSYGNSNNSGYGNSNGSGWGNSNTSNGGGQSWRRQPQGNGSGW
eukprot:NODE_63_length_25098_cov_0.440498.p14 type:complete len:157 gc:universal NODE_63_length_25098_cov_0.440498:17464-16994(-)